MRSLTLASPAKLNLALYVLGKRRDGYHELVTLFHRISLKDTLRLRKQSRGIRLICSHPKVPIRQNLIVRAYDLLQSECSFSGGVSVHLTKRIPVSGGLGGGSSNAASFLIGMKRLFGLKISQKKLMKLGAKLGSDVPFFLSGARQAIGMGRGEKIEPLSFRRRLWFLLLQSPGGLSAREVYSHVSFKRPPLSLTRAKHEVRITAAFLEKGNFKQAAQFLQNNLTGSAEKIRPSLKRARERLSNLQLGTCRMSGSGPTLFFIFLSHREALQAKRFIQKQKLFKPAGIVCHTL